MFRRWGYRDRPPPPTDLRRRGRRAKGCQPAPTRSRRLPPLRAVAPVLTMPTSPDMATPAAKGETNLM